MKALRLLFVLVTLLYTDARSQFFTVLPNNPTENDVIRIAVTTVTCCPVNRVSFTYSVVQGDIYIEGCYAIKNLSTVSYFFYDTVTIGTLVEGIHAVTLKNYTGIDTTSCVNAFDSIIVTDSFEVQPLMPVTQTILPPNATENDSVKIAVSVTTPNPARKISVSYSLGQNDILIKSCFAKTQAIALPQTFHDTLVIGKLQQGGYRSHVTVFYSVGDTNICDTVVDFTQLLDSFTVTKTVFVDDHRLANTSVYPNPTSGEVNILLPEGIEIEQVALQDITGRIVKTATAGRVSVADLPGGLYILQVQTNAGRFVQKLRKE